MHRVPPCPGARSAGRPAFLSQTSAFLLFLGLAACGGEPETRASTTCDKAPRHLRERLGPELGSVLRSEPIPGLGITDGCAAVYARVAEEMPGEVEEADAFDSSVGQHLALLLPDAQGGLVLTLIGASEASPGPVLLTVSLRDVVGDPSPELVVQEDGVPGMGGYRGLRVFEFAAGQPTAREVFSQKVSVTTPEGLELTPEWRTGTAKGARAIIFDGAGTRRIFVWDESTRLFVLSESPAETPSAPPPPPAGGAPAASAEGDPSLDALLEKPGPGASSPDPKPAPPPAKKSGLDLDL